MNELVYKLFKGRDHIFLVFYIPGGCWGCQINIWLFHPVSAVTPGTVPYDSTWFSAWPGAWPCAWPIAEYTAGSAEWLTPQLTKNSRVLQPAS